MRRGGSCLHSVRRRYGHSKCSWLMVYSPTWEADVKLVGILEININFFGKISGRRSQRDLPCVVMWRTLPIPCTFMPWDESGAYWELSLLSGLMNYPCEIWI